MQLAGQTGDASWLGSGEVLPQLLANGYARVGLDDSAADLLANLCGQANRFFSLDSETKSRYAVPKLTQGYRPPESAHATDPTMPDTNDSFIYWSEQRAERIPHRADIAPFLAAFEGYRRGVAAPVVRHLIDELSAYYRYSYELPFEQASLVQVNGFTKPSDRELLQTRHEDGTLLTVIWANAPGLEGFQSDDPISLSPGPDEVVVMPGSVLTTMSGNEIPPFYHRVRNYYNLDRKSIMYFSCPDVDRHVVPFVVNDSNRDANIRELVLSSTDMFGLVDNFVAEE